MGKGREGEGREWGREGDGMEGDGREGEGSVLPCKSVFVEIFLKEKKREIKMARITGSHSSCC